MKQKCISVMVFAVVAFMVVGCKQESQSDSHSHKHSSKVVQVETQTVSARTLTHQVTGYGVVKSHNSVALKTLETSQITAIYFEAGQTVKKGQVLVQFDSSEAKAKVARDQAQFDAKKQTWLRQKELVNKGVVARSTYDDSESDYKQALAQLEQDKSKLTELAVKAPFDGVISQTDFHVGDVVTVGNTLATLYTPDQLTIEYQLPAAQKDDYKLEQHVTVYSELKPKKYVDGNVSYVSPNISMGLVTLKAQLPNAKQFSPGQNVKIVQYTRELLKQVTIPTSSLITNIQGAQVFIVVNNKARLRDVKVGQYYDGYVQILSGLTVGDQLVINGQNYLRTDQKVEVMPAQQPDQTSKKVKHLQHIPLQSQTADK
ncbi:efflux transporter, RND family, MFP subunit [Photobacterium sp. SKA34]|uniref:efflux RND transporter periplasmic adaptor subunit n=1 Tax=Photobacterium sp. SKA34 TaxID=121723 RepID=UPI00006B89D3|nr:efflux RND transporter periplasmic adaptor subunit [Photobacterium sp. SKA34]EAR55223.1 efflux transporter, RND family, MFP subunit [Photobacterium sp. SKA34]